MFFEVCHKNPLERNAAIPIIKTFSGDECKNIAMNEQFVDLFDGKMHKVIPREVIYYIKYDEEFLMKSEWDK